MLNPVASHKGSIAVTLLRNPIERAISHFHFMKVRSLFFFASDAIKRDDSNVS